MTALRNDGMFSNIKQPMILSKSKAVLHTLKLDICLISADIQFTLMDNAYSSNRIRFGAATLLSASTMCFTRALLGSTLPYTIFRLVESSVEIITLTNVSIWRVFTWNCSKSSIIVDKLSEKNTQEFSDGGVASVNYSSWKELLP